jgi:hypothetical protein
MSEEKGVSWVACRQKKSVVFDKFFLYGHADWQRTKDGQLLDFLLRFFEIFVCVRRVNNLPNPSSLPTCMKILDHFDDKVC